MVPRSGTYQQKPTASCEAAQLWVRTTTPPPQTVPRSGTDISMMILRTVHRSRFAEPRECVSVFAYPQRRSFGACSGFQIDTCPIGTRRCSYCHTVTEVASGKKLRIKVSLLSTTKEPQAAWFREAGPTIRNPLQAAKQRSCGYERQHPLHKQFREAGLTYP